MKERAKTHAALAHCGKQKTGRSDIDQKIDKPVSLYLPEQSNQRPDAYYYEHRNYGIKYQLQRHTTGLRKTIIKTY
jgi:hypothetical protein